MSKKRKPVTIHWIDSAGPQRYWNHPEDMDMSCTKIVSRGFAVKETKTELTITTSISDSGCYGGTLSIPKFAITKREDG